MKERLFIFISLIMGLCVVGCSSTDNTLQPEALSLQVSEISTQPHTPELIQSMKLEYAKEFSVDLYEDGYASIRISDGNSYVLVPEGGEKITLDIENPTYIQMPCDNIYLAATAAMDLFHQLDGLDMIKACSTVAEDYSDSEVSNRIKSGTIEYVGKYRAPDYEKLLEKDISLAIESTMIYHSPKIKEELESIDIPVLVEKSSYEQHPLGRLEWIKLYGLLLGKMDEANDFFNNQVKNVEDVMARLSESTSGRPKVVFFYLSSNGYVNVRKPGDYISKMIEMAGGEYALDSLIIEEENALSTVNISWEDFYAYAKDADILIYNGTIDGGILTKDELIRENDMFMEFKALNNDRLYCTENNMYQEVSKTGDIILELYDVINNKNSEYTYIKKVN